MSEDPGQAEAGSQ